MLLSIPRVWDTSQQAILPTLPQRRTGKIRKWVPASYACYSSFLSLLSLFPTTEKKLFCRTYPKEKRCNLKKITTLPKIHIQFCRTFSFVLFFNFLNFFRRCGYNPYSLIAHGIKQRVKLPTLRIFRIRLL